MVKASYSERNIDLKVYKFVVGQFERSFDLKMGRNSTYSQEEICDALIYAAMKQQTLNRTSTEMARYLERICDKPIDVPSPGTAFHHLKKLKPGELSQQFREMIKSILAYAKRWKTLQKERIVAFDFHKKPNYSKRDKRKIKKKNKAGEVRILPLVGMEKKKGTHYGLCWATLDIVTSKDKFTIDVEPVLPLSNRVHVFETVLDRSLKLVPISLLLVDREMFSVDYINAIKSRALNFIMPLKVRGAELKAFVQDVRRHYEWKVKPYTLTNDDGRTATFYVVGYRKVKKKVEDEGDYFFYATNIPIESRHQAIYFGELYRNRWDIEIGYRTKTDFLAKTTSTTYTIRLFYFWLSVLLYNIWCLFNLLNTQYDWLRAGHIYLTTHDFRTRFLLVLLFDYGKRIERG